MLISHAKSQRYIGSGMSSVTKPPDLGRTDRV
jgi:hypothetical protein